MMTLALPLLESDQPNLFIINLICTTFEAAQTHRRVLKPKEELLKMWKITTNKEITTAEALWPLQKTSRSMRFLINMKRPPDCR